MIDFLIAVALMIAVVGLLMAWVVRADNRRRLGTDDVPDRGNEEVA